MTTQLGKPVRRVLLEDGSLRGTDRRHRFDKELQIQRGKCLGESEGGGRVKQVLLGSINAMQIRWMVIMEKRFEIVFMHICTCSCDVLYPLLSS